jgi:tetratricopeptide (TPR) repeat protein
METIVWMEKYLTEATNMLYEGRVEEGLNVLNNLLYEEPGYGNLHNYLGWAYMYYGNDAARAEMHLKMAMHFAGEYAPPYLHMGNLLNRSMRYAEALEYFHAGVTRPEANRPALYEGMAYSYELTGEYRKAIKAYKEAATASALDFEVDRLLKSVRRCRRKRIALMFSF